MDKQPLTGFLLHRREYRETSLLVDFFSREQGKISAVAKGVRGSKSERKSLLQPFQLLLFQANGRHELKNLGSLEALQNRLPIGGRNLFCAIYINELVNRALQPGIAHPRLFDAYHQALQLLLSANTPEPVLREFEIVLLEEMGYLFSFTHDWQSGEAIEDGKLYQLTAEQGFSLIPVSTGRLCFSGGALLAIARADWHAESLDAAKQINRMALKSVIGSAPLKSRELFINQ